MSLIWKYALFGKRAGLFIAEKMDYKVDLEGEVFGKSVAWKI